MNISMPRITDKQLMEWYNLKRSELKEFKENSGLGFMRKQIKEVEKTPTAKELDLSPLKKYMKFVFITKRNLELLLIETEDIHLAFRAIVLPFVFEARDQIGSMPEEFHDYASWYTEQQLRLSAWTEREALDVLITQYAGGKN